MEVNFNTINFQNNNQYSKNIYPCPSFKMKMSELKGIDQFVARKYKINPQPIKTLQEFQKKCKEMVEKISGKDFSGRQEETQVQRKAMINDWYNYVVKENGAYTGAMALMILGGITAGLKPKEDTLPPVLNKGVLADTVTNIQVELKKDEKAQLNFEKEYRLNLQKGIFKEEKALDESLNGWIIIPSKENDPNNFDANVDKLKMLSHDNWCTKSFNAKPYLEKGDFHVYMEKGKPKLGVRFVENEIKEIQGEKNNSKIPLKYGDIAKEHIKNYELTYNAKYELTKLEKTKIEIEKIKSKLPNGINNAPVQEVLEALGIKCQRDFDGLLTISHYGEHNLDFSYGDLGIDENRLFKDIKAIEGNADFYDSQVTNLGNLQFIGKNAYFEDSIITSLGNLQSIGSSAHFEKSKITSLDNLESIGGNAYFNDSQITDLCNLVSIGSYADFKDSLVTSLGKLEFIGMGAKFWNSKIKDLGNLQSIGGNADFRNSQITSLGNLVSIGGDADFRNSKVTDLGNLQRIGLDASFNKSQITSLGNLVSIGGYASFMDSQVKSLGKLKSIGAKALIYDSYLCKCDFSKIKVSGIEIGTIENIVNSIRKLVNKIY